MASTSPAPGEDKLQHVQRIIETLCVDLEERNLSATERVATLEQLKVYGRDPKDCDPIFTREGIEILGKHGFEANKTDFASAREALRCLANALLVVPKTRQIFLDLGFPEKAAAGFKNAGVDDEFLLARILFLITYDTTADLKRLVEEQRLEKSIDDALARHVDACSEKAKPRSPMEDMALEETLKLVFNLSHFVTDKENLFIKSVSNLFKILRQRDLPPFPLRPPIALIINALLNMDLSACKHDAFPPSEPLQNITRLVEILEKSIDPKYTKLGATATEIFDDNGAPLITLFRKVIETAGDEVKTYLKSRLLPCEHERNQPLGKGTTLAARLLQLTNSASAPNTRESISYLLFELSNSNAEEFIRNIGYGYASGFLVTHNIPVPVSSLDPTEAAVAASSSSDKPINPITGQTLDSEPVTADSFEGMSRDEKEREAERLFVLFERHGNIPTPPALSLLFHSLHHSNLRLLGKKVVRRAWANLRPPRNRLKKTGVVNVKNPVETAVEEGRFQELDDDDN
ncbi:guanine nucleotide exchange factor synembryn-domain-containing protein [Trichophaea hybrida]|nr:guanine nucleotide exchange factor synembryn-domain-containing protein [Trichophaea hybrida]